MIVDMECEMLIEKLLMSFQKVRKQLIKKTPALGPAQTSNFSCKEFFKD